MYKHAEAVYVMPPRTALLQYTVIIIPNLLTGQHVVIFIVAGWRLFQIRLTWSWAEKQKLKVRITKYCFKWRFSLLGHIFPLKKYKTSSFLLNFADSHSGFFPWHPILTASNERITAAILCSHLVQLHNRCWTEERPWKKKWLVCHFLPKPSKPIVYTGIGRYIWKKITKNCSPRLVL